MVTNRDALEALDRIRARHPGPTGTNWHFDLDIIETVLRRVHAPEGSASL
jgi:hypothetical protein